MGEQVSSQSCSRYEVLMLEPMPTGVEHAGIREMGWEPCEQVFADTFEVATAEAERMIRHWREEAGTRKAWDAAYAPLHEVTKLTEDGGKVGPFGDEGAMILVRKWRDVD